MTDTTLGSSLQADVTITASAEDAALLRSLGDDLKFVTLTSSVTVVDGDQLSVAVSRSAAPKCARCWHHDASVGNHVEYADLCSRCISNLYGSGEVRRFA